MYDGALNSLRSRYGTRRQIIVDFDEDPDEGVRRIGEPGIELRDQEGPRVRIAFDGQAMSATEVLARASAYGTVRDVSIEEPEIEEVIRQMYEGQLTPDATGDVPA
jgi:ABC-2 type transport system ATP-binding protein